MSFVASLPRRAQSAYYWDVRYMMLEGIFIGICFDMLGFVARKTIGISELQLVLIMVFVHIGPLFSFVMPHIIRTQRKISYILCMSIPCKVMFIFLAFGFSPLVFCCIAACGFFFMFMNVPMYAALLNNIYPDSHRGTISGHVRSYALVATVFTSLAAGKLLDINPNYYHFIFPFTAFCGLLGAYCLSQIHETISEHGANRNTLVSYKDLISILKSDKLFIRYEIASFISGLANLAGTPIYLLYVVDVLQANYLQIALTAGVIHNVVGVLTIRWWGRTLDRRPNPMWQRMVLTGIWILHPLLYAFAWDMKLVYLSSALIGFLFAGGKMNFMLGCLFFCKTDDDAPIYTSIHHFNWGIRGIIAPILGYGLYRWLGFHATFYILAVMMLISSLMMMQLFLYSRKLPRFNKTIEH